MLIRPSLAAGGVLLACAALAAAPVAPSAALGSGRGALPQTTTTGSLAADNPAAHSTGRAEQVGTYAYLTAPDYDALAPVGAAARGKSFALGTFDRLDGELVMVAGRLFRVGTSGTPRTVAMSRRTPFVQAVRFRPQAWRTVQSGTTCTRMERMIDRMVGSSAGMVAVRVRGRFAQVEFRSVAEQSKPYPPLTEVVANQVVFPTERRRAVLVGFRSGPDFAGASAPGLHLHGLTADRERGGHVLSCTTGSGVRLAVQTVRGIRLIGG